MLDSGTTGILISGLLLLLFWTSVHAAYNVFFHPLRYIPGPTARAASHLPRTIRVLRGDWVQHVSKLHQRYGPVVRIAPNVLSFTQPEAWKDLYQRNSKDRLVVRDNSLLPPFEAGPGSEKTLLFADEIGHSHLRRIFGPAFSSGATKEREASIQRLTDIFIAKLDEKATGQASVDLDEWLQYYAFDNGCELVFGQNFRCLEERYLHPIIQTIQQTGKYATLVSELYRYGIWQVLELFIPKSALATRFKTYNFAFEAVDRRIRQGHVHGSADVFSILVKDKNNVGWSPDDLRANGLFFAVAASDSLPFTVCSAVRLLCHSPDALRTLQQELDTHCVRAEDLTFKTLAQLPYLNAVIRETFRIFPPGNVISGRSILTAGGQSIAGQWVPPGTSCSVSPFSAGRSALNFARPDDFVPERWLDEPPAEFLSDSRDASQPFSVGPRSCIAEDLAKAQVRIALSKLVWNFDISLCDASEDWHSKLRLRTVWAKSATRVKLARRR